MFENLKPTIGGKMVIVDLPLKFYNQCAKYTGGIYSPTMVIFERCLYEMIVNFRLVNAYVDIDTLDARDILDHVIKRLYKAIYYEHKLFRLEGAISMDNNGDPMIILENGKILEFDLLLHELEQEFLIDVLQDLWGYYIVSWVSGTIVVLKEIGGEE